MKGRIAILLTILALVLGAARASAHEVRPALLKITEHQGGLVDVTFKRPVSSQGVLRLQPRLSGDDRLSQPASTVEAMAGSQLDVWRGIRLDGGLGNRTVSIAGIDRTLTDVIVVVEFADGHRLQQILKPERPAFQLAARNDGAALLSYVQLGIMHILTGYDHLMFVLGLMLLTPNLGMLVKTITAFTIAHSITLAATALGFLTVSPPKIEMLVALSIVFVAVEVANLRRGRSSITQRWPWVIAFAFGLLHGSAFASALAEIGLPPDNIPAALLLFNGGVEIGQLLFIAVLCGLGFALARLAPAGVQRFAALPAYVIGISACFWVFERFQAATLS